MLRLTTLRLRSDLFMIIKERAVRANRTFANETNIILGEALKGETITLTEVYEELKREINEMKVYLRSVRDAAQIAASLKPRVDKNTELMRLSVKTLDSIEAYLEKHSLQ